MKIVIFGLTVTSSWGNGHATLWRALCKALAKRGHSVVFFERDVPYYASQRDLWILPGCWLHLYHDWSECRPVAQRESANADVALVTSFCPDGAAACEVVLDSSAYVRAFYDMDTPVTLNKLRAGEPVFYLPPRGLGDFDLVLSYTGGPALEAEMQARLGTKRIIPMYGSVDPEAHYPVSPVEAYRCDLSYLGTYAADRQEGVESLLLEPARARPDRRFLMAGAMYPPEMRRPENVQVMGNLPPPEHPAFYCSSRLTLNVTRQAMAQMGYCPSGRLFEAAACGTPILSDWWAGLDQFYEPQKEILIAQGSGDVVAALELSDAELGRIARAARQRTLEEHTAERRAIEFERAAQAALDRAEDQGEAAMRLRRPAALASATLADYRPGRVEIPTGNGRRNGHLKEHGTWGIIPAAGMGTRIQPLAFSKELLPVGSRLDGHTERPLAVSEYLVERMIAAGATKICFVIGPGKSDIIHYYGAGVGAAAFSYVVQPRPAGLCDSIFRALPFIAPDETVLVGLPDTIWFPQDGLKELPENELSFLLFPVDRPELFDAVVTDEAGAVRLIQVKQANAQSHWVWGAFKMPGRVLRELYDLWRRRQPRDEYIGTLVNEYLARGGRASAVRAGRAYVDVGTLNGYRQAIRLLAEQPQHDAPLAMEK